MPLFLQCKGETYLGLDRGLLEERLSRGDYDFFNRVDPQHPPGPEILAFAPGAGYFLGLAALDHGRADLAAHFLGLEADRGQAPYLHWAAEELFTLLNKQDKYDQTLARAAAYLKRYPDTPVKDRVRFLIIEAEYWRKNDKTVLELLDRYFPGGPAALQAVDPELVLFRTVAATRLALPGWEAQVRNFYAILRASSLHQRLSSYFRIEKEKLAAFTDFDRRCFAAKTLLADGRSREAADAYEAILPRLPAAALAAGVWTADYTAAALAEQPATRRGDQLAALSHRLKGEAGTALLEAAGRIYLAAGNNSKSRSTNELVVNRSADSSRKKRAVYRLLKTGLDMGGRTALALFRQYGPRITDPEYFDDVCDGLVSLLVRERRFKAVVETALSPPSWWPRSEKSQLVYTAARLLMTGLADAPDKEKKITALLRAAGNENGRGYYTFMSAYLLKHTDAIEAFFRQAPEDKPERPAAWREDELRLDGLFFFGLYGRALGRLPAARKNVKTATVAYWVGDLNARRRWYEAIQLAGLLRSRDPAAFTRRDFGAYYPRAFADLIPAAATAYGLDEHLFFALVRQESAFNPGIRSSAGAVGLTQLMPDTGEWLAGLLKTKNPNLTDPATSVRFGAYYLDFLKKRLDTLPFILAGYNGGPTNARRWRREYGDLPPDLAVEALDFSETRDFIKSIFSAHVIYDLMYKNTGIAASAALFYNL